MSAVGASACRLVVDVPPGEWISANGRMHHMARAARVRALRERAYWLARSADLPRFGAAVRVRVDFDVVTRTRTRFDPANAMPTAKAIIDGLTDAGVWVDDDHEHVDGPCPHRGPVDGSLPVGWHRLVLTITPMEVAS